MADEEAPSLTHASAIVIIQSEAGWIGKDGSVQVFSSDREMVQDFESGGQCRSRGVGSVGEQFGVMICETVRHGTLWVAPRGRRIARTGSFSLGYVLYGQSACRVALSGSGLGNCSQLRPGQPRHLDSSMSSRGSPCMEQRIRRGSLALGLPVAVRLY